MSAEKIIQVVFAAMVTLIVLAGLLGLNPQPVADFGVKILVWLLPGALFAAAAEGIANAFTSGIPRFVPAGVAAAVWSVIYWGTRAGLAINNWVNG